MLDVRVSALMLASARTRAQASSCLLIFVSDRAVLFVSSAGLVAEED